MVMVLSDRESVAVAAAAARMKQAAVPTNEEPTRQYACADPRYGIVKLHWTFPFLLDHFFSLR